MNKTNSNKNGFSLLEVLCAIFIVTTGIIAILSLFSHNIKNEIDNKNKLIAVYLANESIEIVRQLRDNNLFAGNSWLRGIPTGNVITELDDDSGGDIRKGWEIKIVGNEEKKKVFLSSDDSYVQLNSNPLADWQETGFTRHLVLTENSGGGVAGCLGVTDCLEITSYVSFGGVQLVEVTAYLYDGWY